MQPWTASGGVALLAGLLSFLSPCVLPLVPTYLTYLGASLAEEGGEHATVGANLRLWGNALAFVAGFSVVFIAFGLSASALGQLLTRHQVLLRQASGLLVIFFGLYLTGVLRVPWLYREKRLAYHPRRASPPQSLLMGMAFSAGWTPCIGPALGSILILAGNTTTLWQGGYFLAVYSAGLAIPFLAVSLAVKPALRFLRRWSRLLAVIPIVSGVLMILLGILIFTNYFARLAGFFTLFAL